STSPVFATGTGTSANTRFDASPWACKIIAFIFFLKLYECKYTIFWNKNSKKKDTDTNEH
ncbi:hypothetical protein, partial [Brevibacillus sp. SIMBA_040]|uniref:hypothetical protein n=1 Tax=Brevibacillus sp. SIMBA_040 TaxID=3085781 RepID=UPI003977F41D